MRRVISTSSALSSTGRAGCIAKKVRHAPVEKRTLHESIREARLVQWQPGILFGTGACLTVFAIRRASAVFKSTGRGHLQAPCQGVLGPSTEGRRQPARQPQDGACTRRIQVQPLLDAWTRQAWQHQHDGHMEGPGAPEEPACDVSRPSRGLSRQQLHVVSAGSQEA